MHFGVARQRDELVATSEKYTRILLHVEMGDVKKCDDPQD